MRTWKVAEIFASINGEGIRAGELAVFVRFCGCNLFCSYCDTAWVNENQVQAELLDTENLVKRVLGSGIRNVTITGGEPLIQDGLDELFAGLYQTDPHIRIEVETNGSRSIEPYLKTNPYVCWTADYKLPGSGMENRMDLSNLKLLRECDTVKFVSGSLADLNRARDVIQEYDLTERCHVILSPVSGQIAPVEIVDFMKQNRMNDVRLQLQLHKIIWDPEMRGV